MHSDVDLLPHNSPSSGWVREGRIFLGDIHELVLARRTGEVAPKPFEVDGTDVAASSLRPKDAVDDVDVGLGSHIGELPTAPQFAGLNEVLTGLELTELDGLGVHVEGVEVGGGIVAAAGVGSYE